MNTTNATTHFMENVIQHILTFNILGMFLVAFEDH